MPIYAYSVVKDRTYTALLNGQREDPNKIGLFSLPAFPGNRIGAGWTLGRAPGPTDAISQILRAEMTGSYGLERLPATPLPYTGASSLTPATVSLRKEVIQPQVLLRLPCYDFTPIMSHTLGRCLPCGLARRLLVQPTFVM